MRNRSLAFRIGLLAAGGSMLVLLLAGFVFIYQFRRTVEQNFDARLETLMRTLVAAMGPNGDVDERLVEGRSGGSFSQPLSGWYWETRDAADGRVIDWSASLSFDLLPVEGLPTEEEPVRTILLTAAGGQELRALEWYVTFENGREYAVLVAGETAPMNADIRAFGTAVVAMLGGFAVMLAIGTGILVRWGLRPLRTMRSDLIKVREGELRHLPGDYPAEIEPLVDDLNALIDSNREIVERARKHVGNLAHALKTPLAVLKNEASDGGPLSTKVAEQVEIMREQVSHHLNRARIAAQANVIGAVTPVRPALEALARVMQKVHGGQNLAIDLAVPPELRFRGETQDFEEMAGNLFDNACKWARARVAVSARRELIGRRPFVILSFEDDGPGLPADQRGAALARGGRLDESKPGSGLGLSIVVELARVYGGTLALDDSALGGVAAQLTLPAA